METGRGTGGSREEGDLQGERRFHCSSGRPSPGVADPRTHKEVQTDVGAKKKAFEEAKASKAATARENGPKGKKGKARAKAKAEPKSGNGEQPSGGRRRTTAELAARKVEKHQQGPKNEGGPATSGPGKGKTHNGKGKGKGAGKGAGKNAVPAPKGVGAGGKGKGVKGGGKTGKK